MEYCIHHSPSLCFSTFKFWNHIQTRHGNDDLGSISIHVDVVNWYCTYDNIQIKIYIQQLYKTNHTFFIKKIYYYIHINNYYTIINYNNFKQTIYFLIIVPGIWFYLLHKAMETSLTEFLDSMLLDKSKTFIIMSLPILECVVWEKN